MVERSGYSAVKDTENPSDLLGMKSLFRSVSSSLVKKCLDVDKWFGFCTRVSQDQVDLMSLPVQIANHHDKLSHQATEEYPNCVYRTAVYKYLLRDFMCYVESPMVYKDRSSGAFNDSYNKFLATANLWVIAQWLGISYDDARMSYGSRVDGIWDASTEDSLCPYVKLYVTKEGIHKVSKPRKDLDLSEKGMRVVPLFALKAGTAALFRKANEDFYDVTFVKDSGQVRTVNVCFSLDKLREVYQDEGKLMDEYEKQYKGDFMNVKTLERGYIRVIEVGTNLNCGATRSINLARIIGIKKQKPDLTFVNVDLDKVVDTFISCTNSSSAPVHEIVEMLDLFNVGQSRKVSGREIANVQDLENWVHAQEMLLSTPFIKQLALFMIGNPQWFNGYTGEESVAVAGTGSDEYSSTDEDGLMDFDLDFEI